MPYLQNLTKKQVRILTEAVDIFFPFNPPLGSLEGKALSALIDIIVREERRLYLFEAPTPEELEKFREEEKKPRVMEKPGEHDV